MNEWQQAAAPQNTPHAGKSFWLNTEEISNELCVS